ncbi:hypothetical protein [Cupriavidus sp. H18C1]|uniref:hypothetical protein n=1 Tax=Cupriavidus sp. H18C1 TaxID=3241601 RepID=UPI003BB88604
MPLQQAAALAGPVDVEVVEPAGRSQRAHLAGQRGIERHRGRQRAQRVEVERRRLQRQPPQRAVVVARPAQRDAAHAFAPGAAAGLRLRAGRLPQQRVDGQLVVGAFAPVQQQRLRLVQPQGLGRAGQAQIDRVGAQPRLAAQHFAIGELDGAVAAQHAAVDPLEQAQIALHRGQLQLADIPAGLAAPVAPVALRMQIGMAEGAGDHQRARGQRGRARFQPQVVAGAAAGRAQQDVADLQHRQAALLVEPADLAAGQRDRALCQQPVEKAMIVAAAAVLRAHRHAGHLQPALRRAVHQHVGVVGVEAGEAQFERAQRLPGQRALQRLGRQQHALLVVDQTHAARMEGRMPAIPRGLQRGDGQAGGQRLRAALLQPGACARGLGPQHETHQQEQHRGHGRQRDADAQQPARDPAPSSGGAPLPRRRGRWRAARPSGSETAGRPGGARPRSKTTCRREGRSRKRYRNREPGPPRHRRRSPRTLGLLPRRWTGWGVRRVGWRGWTCADYPTILAALQFEASPGGVTGGA